MLIANLKIQPDIEPPDTPQEIFVESYKDLATNTIWHFRLPALQATVGQIPLLHNSDPEKTLKLKECSHFDVNCQEQTDSHH